MLATAAMGRPDCLEPGDAPKGSAAPEDARLFGTLRVPGRPAQGSRGMRAALPLFRRLQQKSSSAAVQLEGKLPPRRGR